MKRITKILFSVIMLLTMITAIQPVSAQNPGSPQPVLETTKIWVNYNYALVRIEEAEIGMDALITYIGTDLGKDTAKLEAYKNDLISKQDELKTVAENNQPLSPVISDMKTIVRSFRDEARIHVGENRTGALNAIKNAVEENENTIYDMIASARAVHKQHNLEAFDYLNEKAQSKLDEGVSKGIDVTELQAALDEIKQKRTEFVQVMDDAIDSCKDRIRLRCNTTQTQEYFRVRDEIIQDYKDLRELAKNVGMKYKIANAIENGRNIIANGKTTLERAESRNIDVSVEKAKLDEISKLVDSAENNNNNGDYEAAIADMESAKEAFQELRDSVKTRRGSR
ncbi:MAG: hypothetical protein ABIG84_03415 [archaeon]